MNKTYGQTRNLEVKTVTYFGMVGVTISYMHGDPKCP
jgi:hypothetical protein